MALPSTLRRTVMAVSTCCVVTLATSPGRADDRSLLAQAPGGAPAPKPAPQPPAAPKPAKPPSKAAEPAPNAPAAERAAAPAEPAPTEPAAADAPDATTDAPPTDPAAPADSELEPLDQPLSTSAATHAGKARLQMRLRELDAERASTTNFWPWLAVGTGAAVVVVSATVGAVNAFDCEPDTECTAPPWASLAVVIGAAIGAAGAIWLVRTDDEIRELDMQRNQLKLDLERLDYARWRREGVARRGGSQVSFSLSF